MILDSDLTLFPTADCIALNESAIIMGLDDCALSQRLAELGFWPGKSIQLLIAAPWGDPLAFQIDNTTIALRKNEAKLIRVKRSHLS